MRQGISPAVAIVVILIVIVVVVAAGYFLFLGKGGKKGQVAPEQGQSMNDSMSREQAIVDKGGVPGEDRQSEVAPEAGMGQAGPR